MLSRSSRVVAAALAGFATLFLALPAQADSISASAQGTRATLNYAGPFDQAKRLALTIARSGVVVEKSRVSAPMCGHLCWPSPVGSVLRVADLGGAHLDVVLSLYSGGAHCCFIDQVFSTSAAGRVTKSELVPGDPTATLERLAPHGPLVFVTADDAFAYAFTDYAASGLPVKILEFRDHRFLNVTRHYPAVVARDAQRWWRAFAASATSHYADSVGLAAAWAADEVLLGHGAMVARVLAGEARAGHLHSALSPVTDGGQHFITQLDQFLEGHGYRT